MGNISHVHPATMMHKIKDYETEKAMCMLIQMHTVSNNHIKHMFIFKHTNNQWLTDEKKIMTNKKIW